MRLHAHLWHPHAVPDVLAWAAGHDWSRIVATGPHAAELPGADVLAVPNRGADCAAFLAALRHAGPGVWFKAHTKRDDGWRHQLHAPLFAPGRPAWVAEQLHSGRHHLAGARAWCGGGRGSDPWGQDWYGANAGRCRELCRRAGARWVRAKFVAGTTFAVSERLAALLLRAAPAVDEFEEGHAADGQWSHAFERFVGVAAASLGRPILMLDPV